jgi:hypothetical protein
VQVQFSKIHQKKASPGTAHKIFDISFKDITTALWLFLKLKVNLIIAKTKLKTHKALKSTLTPISTLSSKKGYKYGISKKQNSFMITFTQLTTTSLNK